MFSHNTYASCFDVNVLKATCNSITIILYEGKALYETNNPACTFHAARRDIMLILSGSDRQEF